MKNLFYLVFLSFTLMGLAAAVSGATSVTVTEPFNAAVQQGGRLVLGSSGPGQTFFVTISAATTNQSGSLFPLGWNRLVAYDLPSGWVAQNSSLNTPTLSVKIRPFANASNGTYSFRLMAINTGNESKLGNLTFSAYVNVTPNVFRLNASPSTISAGIGEPENIYVTINNTGVSDNPFIISITGLPNWNESQTVIALHNTTREFVYPIYENEPGQYSINLTVTSESSPLVRKQDSLTLVTQASLLNDWSAIGDGPIAFPIIYEPAYSVMYLISTIFKH